MLQVITPSRFAGAERVVLELAQALSSRGHEVTVLTTPEPRFVAALQAAGLPFGVEAMGGKLNALAPVRLARAAQRARAEVIHTHLSTATLWGSLVGRRTGIPVVSHVHALGTTVWYRWADALLAVSEAVQAHLLACGLEARRLRVVRSGLSLGRLHGAGQRAVVREELGLGADDEVVVVAAHLSRKKGHHVLLEALARLVTARPRLRCVCVGAGPQLAALQRQAEELGLAERVRFLGHREDAPGIMRAAEVVVLPSVSGEGLSLALIEAALLGLPAVTTRVAGAAEVVCDGETGLVVSPNDADALAAALEQLLAAPRLRTEMGGRAREWAERAFAPERMAAETEQVYYEVLNAAAGAS